MGFFATLLSIAKPIIKTVAPPLLNMASSAITNLEGQRFDKAAPLEGFRFTRDDTRMLCGLGDDEIVEGGSTDLVQASQGLTTQEAAAALVEVGRMNAFTNQMPVVNFQETQVERTIETILSKTWAEPAEGETENDNSSYLRYYDHAYYDITPGDINNGHFNKLLDEFDFMALTSVVVTIDPSSDIKTPTHFYYMPYSKETKMYANADALRDVSSPSKFNAESGEYTFNINNPAFKKEEWTFRKIKRNGKDTLVVDTKVYDVEPKASMERLVSTEFLKETYATKEVYGDLPKEKVIALLKNKPENMSDMDYLDGKTITSDILTYGRIICTKDRMTPGEKATVTVRIKLYFSCVKMIQSYAHIGRSKWSEDVTITREGGKIVVGSHVTSDSMIGYAPNDPNDADYEGDGEPNGDDKGDDGDGEDTGAYLDPIVPATNYTDATRSSRKGFRSKQ